MTSINRISGIILLSGISMEQCSKRTTEHLEAPTYSHRSDSKQDDSSSLIQSIVDIFGQLWTPIYQISN